MILLRCGITHLEVLLVPKGAVLDHVKCLYEARIVVLPLCALALPPGWHLALVHAKDEQILLPNLLQVRTFPLQHLLERSAMALHHNGGVFLAMIGCGNDCIVRIQSAGSWQDHMVIVGYPEV